MGHFSSWLPWVPLTGANRKGRIDLHSFVEAVELQRERGREMIMFTDILIYG